MIVGGVAVGKVSAYRRQIAHLRISNHCGGIEQERVLCSHEFRRFQLRLTREAPNLQKAAVLFDIRKTGNAIDIDQMAGSCQAQLHHGYKALSATQDLGVVSMLLQKAHGFRQRLRPEIFESWRYHGPPLSTSNYRFGEQRKAAIRRGVPYITANIMRESLSPKDVTADGLR